jgi:hypothetical protein
MENVLYFDLETQNGFRAGARNPEELKISVAVTYSTRTKN